MVKKFDPWYCNWLHIKAKLISINDYNKIIDIAKTIPGIKKYYINIEDPIALDISIGFINTNTWSEIRLSIEEGFFRFLFRPNKNCEDILTNAKNIKDLLKLYDKFKNDKDEMDGRRAFLAINRRFKYQYKKNIVELFSGNEYKEIYKAIKHCIPSPVNYCDKEVIGKITYNAMCADISSAYPYQLTKDMPTLHGCMFKEGRIKPTADYPYAFYIKSHHIAIYNELDTRDFANYDYIYPSYNDNKAKWRPDDFINSKNEITVLCKKSDYSFKNIVEKLYNGRKKHPEYKDYLNMCTGYFAMNINPQLSPLLGVIRARHAKLMFEYYIKLQLEGKSPLMIGTDAIIWTGGPSKYATDTKKLGSFTYVWKNAEVAIAGVKKYQVKNECGEVLTHWAGNANGANAKFGEVLTAKDTGLREHEFIRDNDNKLILINKGRAI